MLFDNNVPAPLRRYLANHEIRLARQMGWHEVKNGDLLSMAERSGFELMVTGDKNLVYQQNLAGRKIALVVLATIHWPTLRVDVTPIVEAVNRAVPGSFERL